MDDDLRGAFATFSAQMSGIASDVSANTALTRTTLSEVRQLGGRVDKLERHVFGSDPPPTPDKHASVVKRITNNEGETADLVGRVLNVQASITEVRRDLAVQGSAVRESIADVRSELALQSKQAGIHLRGLKWLTSKDGRTSMVRLATLAGAVYAALHVGGAIH